MMLSGAFRLVLLDYLLLILTDGNQLVLGAVNNNGTKPFLTILDAEVLKRCPLATSNNLAVDYAVSTNFTKPLELSVTFLLYRFDEINDLEQRMTIIGEVTFGWKLFCPDTLCADVFGDSIPKDKYNVITLVKRPKQIWRPRVAHDNFYKVAHPFEEQSVLIDVLPCMNKVLWAIAGMFDSSCSSFSFEKFPFDTLSCYFGIYTDHATEVLVFGDVVYDFDVTTIDTFISDTEIWELVHPINYTKSAEGSNDGLMYDNVKFFLNFKRKYSYFVNTIFLPTMGLFVLQIGGIFLPPEVPDKAAFGITVVLADAFIFTLVFSSIPRTSEQVYLVSMVTAKFVCGIILTTYSLVMVSLSRKWKHVLFAMVIFGKPYKFSLLRVADLVVASLSSIAVIAIDTVYLYLMVRTDD